jgi:hypothetical protein
MQRSSRRPWISKQSRSVTFSMVRMVDSTECERRTSREFSKKMLKVLFLQKNIDLGGYRSVSDLELDMELLVNNARTFYDEGTQQYEDAGILKVVSCCFCCVSSSSSCLTPSPSFSSLSSLTCAFSSSRSFSSSLSLSVSLPSTVYDCAMREESSSIFGLKIFSRFCRKLINLRKIKRVLFLFKHFPCTQ